MGIGAEDYRRAALARFGDARALYESALCRKEGWSGCIYLAGRAVESILRSLLWTAGSDQTIGHDLKQLRKEVLKKPNYPKAVDSKGVLDAINDLSIVWSNNLRFADDEKLRQILKQSGRIHQIGKQRVKGDPLKTNAKIALYSSEAVLSHLEPTCQKNLKQK